MNETTYGLLDKVLRALGFSCRTVTLYTEARYYEHPRTGAKILLPPFQDDKPVLPHHLNMVRTTLDGFGIADPTDFAARLLCYRR